MNKVITAECKKCNKVISTAYTDKASYHTALYMVKQAVRMHNIDCDAKPEITVG